MKYFTRQNSELGMIFKSFFVWPNVAVFIYLYFDKLAMYYIY